MKKETFKIKWIKIAEKNCQINSSIIIQVKIRLEIRWVLIIIKVLDQTQATFNKRIITMKIMLFLLRMIQAQKIPIQDLKDLEINLQSLQQGLLTSMLIKIQLDNLSFLLKKKTIHLLKLKVEDILIQEHLTQIKQIQ